ncbi:hypothetical protein JBL43_05595 [Aureibaculum sp. A20]|uniref:Uncharacterized protein n=1 Tax=Aureibaculum flavum TaxID=2795986 RepID=A0ABS0WNY8_9FLAO|nr:hypothetical protein [Aureibaculum flavum]MBJ2173701.1 hypothetical protein [Aureibaculum flavum]
MKYKILLFCLVSNLILAQHKNMTKEEVKEITSLGKQAIIELALKKIDKKVDTSNFKSIKVMASKHDIYVSFQNPIIFVPENSVYLYNATVYIKGQTYAQPYKNPEDIDYNSDEVQFFKYDDDVYEKIKFVIKAISKQDHVESIDWKYYQDSNGMVIYDKGDHYYVDVAYGKFSEGAYTIDKTTGVATEEYIASIEPYPGEDDIKFVEIKN